MNTYIRNRLRADASHWVNRSGVEEGIVHDGMRGRRRGKVTGDGGGPLSDHSAALARLFNECGWTQEQIARHRGKKQPWVSRRLLVGRLLMFMPRGKAMET